MESHAFGALPGELFPSRRDGQLLRVVRATSSERWRLSTIMDAYLLSHPTTSGWRDIRARLAETPRFAKYRKDRFASRYERAVHALGAGRASASELELVRSLGAEIAGSPLILKSGQVVLSGDINETVLRHGRHETYLWATLHPVSAAESAEAQTRGTGARFPTVHVLRLDQSLPALLGRARPQGSWDLLLPRRLQLTVTETRTHSALNVREAVLGL